MEINLLVNLGSENLTDTENIFGKMALIIKEILVMDIDKDTVNGRDQMILIQIITKANTLKI